MANIPLDLSSKAYRITANAGNDITFAFEFIAINTTGFTFEFRIYGPDGVLIKTLTIGDGIVNTPGTNSIVTITIGVTLNPPSRQGTELGTQFWRTDVSNVRTFATGPLVLV